MPCVYYGDDCYPLDEAIMPKGNKHMIIVKLEGGGFGTPFVCSQGDTEWHVDWDYGECYSDINFTRITESVALEHVKRMREKYGKGTGPAW